MIFSLSDFVEITDIEYMTVMSALAQVGGISVMVRVSIVIVVKYFVYRKWDNDVLDSITNWCDPPQNNEEKL